MPSRQDQLHSYQFMVQRVVAALVMRETDPVRSPFRRAAGATLAGVLLTALALAAVAAYGLISPGGSGKWQRDNVVIEEKGTGATYVYRDGVLHPVLNYASALLVLDASGAKTVSVAQRSLDGVPRGAMLGIPGAPESLPTAKRLTAAPWTVCSRRGATSVESILFVGGARIPGGQPLVGSGGDTGKALLVSTPDGAHFLIHNRYRHFIPDPDRVVPALLWVNRTVGVATALVNALPAGQELRVPDFGAERGRPVARPVGGKVGQVYRFQRSGNTAEEFFVALPAGLAAVTALEAALILNDPRSAAGGPTGPTELSRPDFADLAGAAGPLAPRDIAGALPPRTPDLVDQVTGAVCAEVVDASGAGGVRHGVPVPEKPGTPTSGTSPAGTALADRVVVPPGSGALVESVSSDTATAGQLSVVTDLAIAHAVPSADVAARLGYGGRRAVRMPAEVVALVPRGPSLDPAAARSPVPR